MDALLVIGPHNKDMSRLLVFLNIIWLDLLCGVVVAFVCGFHLSSAAGITFFFVCRLMWPEYAARTSDSIRNYRSLCAYHMIYCSSVIIIIPTIYYYCHYYMSKFCLRAVWLFCWNYYYFSYYSSFRIILSIIALLSYPVYYVLCIRWDGRRYYIYMCVYNVCTIHLTH